MGAGIACAAGARAGSGGTEPLELTVASVHDDLCNANSLIRPCDKRFTRSKLPQGCVGGLLAVLGDRYSTFSSYIITNNKTSRTEEAFQICYARTLKL